MFHQKEPMNTLRYFSSVYNVHLMFQIILSAINCPPKTTSNDGKAGGKTHLAAKVEDTLVTIKYKIN